MPSALIMAGGTGGHIFPALAVAKQLRSLGWDIEWLGTADRLEAKVVPENAFPIHFLPVKGIRGKGLVNRISGLFGVLRSIVAAFGHIRKQRTDVVVGFGGYPSFPGGVAAKILARPLVIHEQNAIPGLTNKLLGKIATKIFVGFPLAKSVFEQKGLKAEFVGNPVREDIQRIESQQQSEKERAFRLLILGGSLGARPLNQQVPKLVAELKSLEVWHQCGANNEGEVASLYNAVGSNAKVTPFIDDMAAAYQWADAVICRAGALTVAEVAKAGLPAMFVPLPHAVDDHQTKNAQFLEEQGAGVVIPQSQLQEKLPNTLSQWMSDRVLCRKMGEKASQCLPNHAADEIVAACQRLVKE